jgi:hypothetical protein
MKTSYDDIQHATLIQYVSDLMAILLISSLQFSNVSTYIRNHIYVYRSRRAPHVSVSRPDIIDRCVIYTTIFYTIIEQVRYEN